KVPVIPYNIPIPVKKKVEAKIFMAIYFTAPSNCALRPPSVNNTKEEIITTSNQTYRLKISPVKKAPFNPMIKKWKIGKKPYNILALPTPVAENIDTANAEIAVSNTKVVLSKSATKTIPKGASQLPAFMVSIPPLYTLVNKLKANPSATVLPNILNTRCVTV